MTRFLCVAAIVVALSACTPTPPTTSGSTSAVSAAVATECALLERAYAATQASGQAALPDILVGCPGREGLRDSMGRFESASAFTRAGSAPVPAAAASSSVATGIFQRMIARGVPVDVATAMTSTAEIAAAVAAQS